MPNNEETRRYRVLKGRHKVAYRRGGGQNENTLYGPRGTRRPSGEELPSIMELTPSQAADKLARGMIEPIAESLKVAAKAPLRKTRK